MSGLTMTIVSNVLRKHTVSTYTGYLQCVCGAWTGYDKEDWCDHVLREIAETAWKASSE